jgi:hypothetical protein
VEAVENIWFTRWAFVMGVILPLPQISSILIQQYVLSRAIQRKSRYFNIKPLAAVGLHLVPHEKLWSGRNWQFARQRTT